MSKEKISLLKKVLKEILDSYSELCGNRGCNDFDASVLNLSESEKEIAISLINKDADGEFERDFIGFDFDLAIIARNLMDELDDNF